MNEEIKEAPNKLDIKNTQIAYLKSIGKSAEISEDKIRLSRR
jgi:hypothetical protein